MMTEQEKTILIETEQRSKSNGHRLDTLEEELRDVKNDQKAIYSIATSVEVIAQRVTNIEGKVDDTNQKVDAQVKAWQETERKLSHKVDETASEPFKKTAANVNSIKIAIITAVLTALASGATVAIISLIK
jgi:hypothetical protein